MSKSTRDIHAPHTPVLVRGDDGLALTCGDLSYTVDFAEMLPRLKQGNLERELLVKAVRIKGHAGPLSIVDATAGSGEDALLLAAAGHDVRLYERDETIAALLADALDRASGQPELAAVVSRMELVCGDSIEALASGELHPDVVVLDPMFPAKRKSALVNKKLQLIQMLEKPCDDEEELLEAALASGARRIVVKRPVKGPHLAGVKPSHSLSGKAVRYDVIVRA